MPGPLTPRAGLATMLGGTDTVAEIDDIFNVAMTRVDAIFAIDDQGLHDDRPAPARVKPGCYYWATDSRTLSRSDGTAWSDLMTRADLDAALSSEVAARSAADAANSSADAAEVAARAAGDAAETAAWRAADSVLSAAVAAVRDIGEIRMTGRATAARGWLLLGGPPPRRADYPLLLDAITAQQNCTTTARSRTLVIESTRGLRAGCPIEGVGIPAATTIAAIVDATTVTLSAAATATARGVAVRFFVWGNGDGVSTFDLPPADRAAVGASSTRPAGSTWGAETHQHGGNIPAHTHSITADGSHRHSIAADGNHAHGMGQANRGTATHPSLSGSGEGAAYTNHVHPIDPAGFHSHGGETGSTAAHSHGGATGNPSATAFLTDAQNTAQPSVAFNLEIYAGA